MRRRRWVVLAAAVPATALAVFVLWPSEPRPCRATFERVRQGMTREEVVATVGAPPTRSGLRVSAGGMSSPSGSSPVSEPVAEWHADGETSLLVTFDDDGRVASVWVHPPRPPLSERLRARLGL
jgi:hypothetical protein